MDEGHDEADNTSPEESDRDEDMTPNHASPRTATPSSEDSERDANPITIPSRPAFGRRLSTYQNTPMDVDRGRSARRLRNPRPRCSI